MPSPSPAAARIDVPCPACGSAGLDGFFAQDGVPLQSNLLLTTRAEALAMPAGDLRLGFCRACGFVANAAFDPASQELSAQYEASQGFSGTFNAFAKSLAQRWADRYELAGKTAVEIGCGKGEFLALLCAVGKCRGVGFDPTLDPARLPPTEGLDVEWVPARFDAAAAARLAAAGRAMDFACCRHTLEHVPDVAAFVQTLRAAIGDRDHVRVGFEVPDTLRVLREGAFWDLYYEHCSYFTAGSLRGLFERCGFEVLAESAEFDGQYLILEAKPAGAGVEAPGTAGVAKAGGPAPGLAEVAAAVARFPALCQAQIDRWRGMVEGTLSAGRRVTLWGASSKAVGFLTALGLGHDRVPVVVDINPHKLGSYLPTSGCEIVGPADLTDAPPDVVIVMNPIYTAEITRDLRGRGIGAEVVAL
ncbi:MAG: C-methyltransferase [Phycisphaerales bacterium]|nr:C-methyltransferase [Phycisphaerales bacterium]